MFSIPSFGRSATNNTAIVNVHSTRGQSRSPTIQNSSLGGMTPNLIQNRQSLKTKICLLHTKVLSPTSQQPRENRSINHHQARLIKKSISTERNSEPTILKTKASSHSDNQKIFEKAKIRVAKTYGYVTANIGLTAGSAALFYQTGLAEDVLHFANNHHPLLSFATSMAVTIPPLLATLSTPKDKSILKHLAFTSLSMGMGLTLSPFAFFGAALTTPAALITTGVTGALTAIALKAPNEAYLKFKGPCTVGLGAVAAAGVLSLAMPGSIGSLAHAASLYGGLAVFSGLMIADTQEVYHKAEKEKDFDEINESFAIYLDILNIFTRIHELQVRKKFGKQENTSQETQFIQANTILGPSHPNDHINSSYNDDLLLNSDKAVTSVKEERIKSKSDSTTLAVEDSIQSRMVDNKVDEKFDYPVSSTIDDFEVVARHRTSNRKPASDDVSISYPSSSESSSYSSISSSYDSSAQSESSSYTSYDSGSYDSSSSDSGGSSCDGGD